MIQSKLPGIRTPILPITLYINIAYQTELNNKFPLETEQFHHGFYN